MVGTVLLVRTAFVLLEGLYNTETRANLNCFCKDRMYIILGHIIRYRTVRTSINGTVSYRPRCPSLSVLLHLPLLLRHFLVRAQSPTTLLALDELVH